MSRLEAGSATATGIESLTAREGQILARVASGDINKEIGYDLGIPEENDQAEAAGVFQSKCTEFVRNAAEILEMIL